MTLAKTPAKHPTVILDWPLFVFNVINWGEVRDLYLHSNAMAQAAKAVTEFGETMDAILKGRKGEQIDGIGDTLVCLVHAAVFHGIDPQELAAMQTDALPPKSSYPSNTQAAILRALADLVEGTGRDYTVSNCIAEVMQLAYQLDLGLSACLTQAWHDIKDRKGSFSAAGVFVKEGDEGAAHAG